MTDIIEFIILAFVVAVFIGLVLIFLSALPFLIVATIFVIGIWVIYRAFKSIKNSIKSNGHAQNAIAEKYTEDTMPTLINKDGRVDTRKTILMIDDDTFLLDMYGAKFSKAGFNMYTLPTAIGDIVQKVLDVKPDLIVQDVIRPVITGFETARLLNSNESTARIPFIFLTNQSGDNIEIGKKFGCIDYIIKNETTPSEVVNKVLKFLET